MSAPETLDRHRLNQFPLPAHSEDSDKEDRGRLLGVAGSRELTGAALLAGIGGLRAGAGKLQVATAASVAIALSIAIPEARVIGCPESEEGCLAPDSMQSLLDWTRDAQSLLIGCGLQHGPPLDAMLDALLGSGLDTPLVLDAAVLGSLAPRAEALRGWRGGAILLPHAREMARLLDCELEEVEADPLAAARRAAQRFDAAALVAEGATVGLATSGSGDALAGIVGGLAARGADPLTATLWGVYLHGEAGRILTKEVGRIGFLARELLDRVPGLMEGEA